MAEIIACEPITLTPRTTLVLAQMAYAEVSCRSEIGRASCRERV